MITTYSRVPNKRSPLVNFRFFFSTLAHLIRNAQEVNANLKNTFSIVLKIRVNHNLVEHWELKHHKINADEGQV